MATITGLKGGTTNITLTYAGKSTTISNFTVNKLSNQITVNPTSATIYTRTGYNTITVTLGNVKGITNVSVSSYTGGGNGITISGSGSSYSITAGSTAGTAVVHFTDTGNTQYASSSVNLNLTIANDYITSYDTPTVPTISQKANLPCGGVTLSTSNVETYFQHSTSIQTVTYASGYFTTINVTSYTWTVTSGSVASWGNTLSDSTRNVSINIKVTANGGGGSGNKTDSAAKTTAVQAANPISSYSKVNAPTITQKANFPCNGVTLTTSNISTYFNISATQPVTLCSGGTTNIAATGYTWTITNGSVASWGNTLSNSTRSVTINISATASGGGTNTTSNSTGVTSGTQAANPISSYGSVNTPSVSQKANFPCGGVTLSNSNIATYFNYSATQNVTLCSGGTTTVYVPASGLSWTYTDGTIAGWGNTLSNSTRTATDFNITLTATGSGSKSNTKQVTSGTQAANPISSYGDITASASQKANFPCSGVTLSTSNIGTYYNYSASQAVTLCSGGSTSISLSVSTSNWTITSGSIPSLSGTETNSTTARTINLTFSVTNQGKTGSKSITSGNQEANPIQSYGEVTASASQGTYLPRGGVTLTTSNIASYFNKSASQTVTLKCGTRAGSITWGSWSGSSVTIPSLCNSEVNSYTSRTVSFSITATGEGSKSKTVNITSASQEKNQISSYGEVSASVSQTSYIPRAGVSLSTSNIETYFTKGTPSQTITLQCGTRAGSVSWGNWSGTTVSIPSLSGTQADNYTSRTVSFSITATGEGSKSKTVNITSANQEKNQVSSYGNVTASTSQKTNFPCGGVTLTTSNIETYYNKSASQTITLQLGTRAGNISWGGWSGNSYSIPSLNNTLTSAVTSRSGFSFSNVATGEGSKTATATATSGNQEINSITAYNAITVSASQKSNFPCGGVTLSTSNIGTYYNYSASQAVTLKCGSTNINLSVSSSNWTITSGSIPSLNGTETNAVTARTINLTFSVTNQGKTGSKSITSGNQEANPITSYGDVSASVSQGTQFPCAGVTLTTSNIGNYFTKGTPTQTITLKCGTRAGSVSWGNWSGNSVTIPSLSGTQKDSVTSRTISFSITATGEGSKSKTVSLTSGNQEANPVQSYGNVTATVSQSTQFPCGGVTLTTSNIETYFTKGTPSQTVTLKCGTRAGSVSWGNWSGSNVSIPSLSGTQTNSATSRTISFSITATGEGSKSKTVSLTSGNQEANTVQSYGDVTASVSQTSYIPRAGVSLSTSNIETYFTKGTPSQTVTLKCGTRAGSVSWGNWSGSNVSIPSLSGTQKDDYTSRTISFSITASGEGSKSKTVTLSSASQEKNQVSSYGNVTASTSQSTQFPCAGVTLTTSNIGSYFNKSASQTVTLQLGTRAGSISWGNWSGSSYTVPSLSGTQKDSVTARSGFSFSITATGEGSKTATATATSGNQETNPVQSYGALSGTISTSQKSYYTRAGGTLQASQMSTYFTSSGISQTVTLKCGTRTGSVSYTWSGNNVSIPDLINTQKNDYTARTVNFTVTVSGEGSVTAKTATVTSILQEKNEISSYGDVTASVSQKANFPCSGVTLSTSNVETYYQKGTTSQTITLQRGTRAGSVSWGNWSVSGTVPSLSGTETNAVTARTVSVSITASGEGSKSKTVSITSGNQEANPIQSYGNVSASTSQSNQFPCGGVTLSTSNIASYFNKSASQTVTLKCGTRAGNITWGNWSGSSYSIPSLGNTITSTTTARSGFSFSITATGEGSKSATATATSGNQATNPISSYGTVNTPSVSQKANFPCAGVTLSASNISTYYTWSATQNVTLCSGGTTTIAVPSSGFSWTYTDGAIAGWGNTLSNSTRTVTDFNITLTATGSGSKSNTKQVTSGTQAANPIASYGAVGTPTITQKANFPCGGVTLTTSNIGTYFNYSAVTQTVTLCSGGTTTINPTGYAWSGNDVSIPSLGKTTTSGVTERAISFTITASGSGSKSSSATVSKGNQAANPYSDTWNNISITTYSYSNIGAGGGTSTPTVTASQSGTRTWCSGSTETLTGSLSYSYAMTTGSGFSINTSTGKITVDNRGTTIGNSRTSNNATVTVSGSGSKTATKTATCTQSANYVTSITAKSDTNTDGTHFSYGNIGAGSTSASPSLSGGALYTFSSGSTAFDASGSPSFGGSATYTRQYTLGTVQNGFTAVNSSSGVLTATHRGTTPGAARTSGTVTGTLVVKYTHPSTYSGGGTVTSSTKSNTQTCTQNANYLTIGNVTLTVSSPTTPYSMTVSGETKTISASASQSGTYSSGSTDTYTPTISYAVKTAVTGYSLSSNNVTVTNNTSTSARNGFVVTVTAAGVTGTDSTYISGYNKTATSDRTFNQAAGSKSYGTPSITAYTYASFPASGDTKSPASVTYTQTWTWNGVANSGGSITSGGTLAYSTTGTLPSGFSTASDFATSGKVTWANRTTTVGNARSAKSNLLVKVTLNGVTSGNYTCTSCDQVANSLGTQKYKNTSGTTGYNVVYVAPSCTLTNNLTAADGSVTVTCTVTNNTNWYQQYTSGSYTSLQSGTEAGTARWMITSNGNSRFSHPSSGGSSLSGVGTVYNSGTSASHSNMTTNATTDTVGITAYNVGDATKTSGQKTASVSNSVVSITLKINGKTDSTSVAFGSEISASNIVVIGTYTSGASGEVTPSGITSSDTSVATVS